MFEIPPANFSQPSQPKQMKMTTALLIFAALCLVGAFSLAIIANRPTGLPVGDAPTTTTTILGSMTEKQFDLDVKVRLPYVDVSDAHSIGHSLCALIKGSNVNDAMVQYATLANEHLVDAKSAAIVARDGISTYCPEYLAGLEAWVNKN